MFYINGQIKVRNWFLRILSLLVIMTYLLLGGWPLVVSIPDPKLVKGLFAGINIVVFMILITIVMKDNINWDNIVYSSIMYYFLSGRYKVCSLLHNSFNRVNFTGIVIMLFW